MAREVAEIMNPELFSVGAHETTGDVIAYLLGLGISAAPVLDSNDRPVGFVALRDLVDAREGEPVGSVMTTPVDVVDAHATIRAAAAFMAQRSRHHVVCVDQRGYAVGFVSLLDIVRGLIGAPVCHPESLKRGPRWSDPIPFALATVALAPASPGWLVLIEGAPDRPDCVLWSERSDDVRRRLHELSTRPGAAPPRVCDAALGGHLWFRAAVSPTSCIVAVARTNPR